MLRRSASRFYVNVFFRRPLRESIPLQNTGGESVDPDLFLRQYDDFISVLRTTELCDNVIEMRSGPLFESSHVSDLIATAGEVIIPMPKLGREHRSSEMSETVRHMRGRGARAQMMSDLQETEGARADAGDFLNYWAGTIIGYDGQRTNRIAADAAAGISGNDATDGQQSTKTTPFDVVELAPGAMPLADLLSCTGSCTLLVRSNHAGASVAAVVTNTIPRVNWQVVNIDEHCSVFSHRGGHIPCNDVIIDEDFETSIFAVGEMGLNVIPVAWTEPRKLGLSMRRLFFLARFSTGTMGVAQASTPADRRARSGMHTRKHHNHAKMGENRRLFNGANNRQYSDMGAPMFAQLRAGELADTVDQPVPRYAPPMHLSARHKQAGPAALPGPGTKQLP